IERVLVDQHGLDEFFDDVGTHDFGDAEAMPLMAFVGDDGDQALLDPMGIAGMGVPRRVLMPACGVPEHPNLHIHDFHGSPLSSVMVAAVLSLHMMTDKFVTYLTS